MIFIAYENEHIEEASRQAGHGTTIICLNLLLEKECKKRGLTYLPLRNYVDSESGEEIWWKLSHDISREWYRLPSMDFFAYRGIRLAEAPEPIMQAYLAKIFYFVRVFSFLKKAFPQETFIVPHSFVKNYSPDCLAAFQPWAVLDAARMAGIISPSSYSRVTPTEFVFEKKSSKTWLLQLYNFLIGFAPRRKKKVYMSGYWMHGESLVPLLEDTELIILETRKFRDIPWKLLFKHRMRFKYSHGPVSQKMASHAQDLGKDYLKKWRTSKSDVEKYLQSIDANLDWSPIVDACEHMVTYSPRIVADIDTLYDVMKKEKPDIVLEMASVGGTHHYFFLMAQVARLLSIPSVEMQHATVTIDPRSVFCRIETDYLLTYGEHINDWHRRIGNGHKKLVPVGSPRFDRYVNEREEGARKGRELFKQLGLDDVRPVLLVAVPYSETYASAVDSYQLQEFFEVIAEVQKNTPGLQLVFKCRIPKLVASMREYLDGLFHNDFAITGDEDIYPYICASDAVICNNSTVIYQAVLTKKPLVLYPWKRFDSYHAELYSSKIPIVYTQKDAVATLVRIFSDPSYKAVMLEKQSEFLEGYMFDGKSSRRVAEFIKNLAL